MFSANANSTNREEVKQKLQIEKETLNERYLGLPAHVSRSKGSTSAYLKDHAWQHIQGLKDKMLSWARKEVLIKAVAQAIHPRLQWVALKLQKAFEIKLVASLLET